MGFANGLRAGTSSAKSWIGNYERKKKEGIENELFKVGMDLQAGREQLDAEGNAIEGGLKDFQNSSTGDIANAMMSRVQASGGTVDDQTYRLSLGVASTLTGMRDDYTLFQDKLDKQDAMERNYESMISSRSNLSDIRSAEHERKMDGNWNPKGTDDTDMTEEEAGATAEVIGNMDDATFKLFQAGGYDQTPKGLKLFKKDQRKEASTIRKEKRSEETAIRKENRKPAKKEESDDLESIGAENVSTKKTTKTPKGSKGKEPEGKSYGKSSKPDGTTGKKNGKSYITRNGKWYIQ